MTEAEHQFVEAMGLHFEAEGVPRIGGRMFAFLLLRRDPCSLDDLVEQLDVSKASVSTNARLLVQWGVVQRVGVPGDRRDFYEVTADPTRTLELQLARTRSNTLLLEQGAAAASDPELAARFQTLVAFHAETVATLETLLSRWRDTQGR